MKTKTFIITSAFLCLSLNVSAQNATSVNTIKTFKIGGNSDGWDYLTVNPKNNLLYVSHGTRVNVLNKTTGESIGEIKATTGVHGIAFTPNSTNGFITCGKLNSVKVFDIKTNLVTAEIPVGQNPDAIFYEAFSKKLIVCNGKTNNISVIDPKNNTVVNTIDVGGKPETAVSNGKGKIFVNIEDKNEIVVIDAKKFTVTNHWNLNKEEGPSGLAMDPKTNRLFSTCDKMLVILDSETGKLVKKMPIGDGCDGAVFDDKTSTIYTSNGEGNISVILEKNASQFVALKNIITKKGARTIALDSSTHHLYLPTADFEDKEKDNRGRPRIKEGTFQVIAVKTIK
ncbi:YVTN family beta-propeller protein [Chryseobacterium ginsenosidimutans]|uniref:YncE family protein n=1 Tax=Chryseobacterium ginsenosidimutans TaxID=687846 RepID=UPI00278898A6|nr:YncE family protein [Chryseobacterium ginsenosidimutans]MDQ0595194.1 YVTN family beta-propeller protein [Chryseobacterium ginsenosidimutans]